MKPDTCDDFLFIFYKYNVSFSEQNLYICNNYCTILQNYVLVKQ